VAVVKMLLAKDGVDINSKDHRGRTPLSLAKEASRGWLWRGDGYEAVIKLLTPLKNKQT